MSKAEGRGGNPSIPTGQDKRGFPADNMGNPKTKSGMMSIQDPGTPGVLVGGVPQSSSAGFPIEDSPNQVKGGSDTTPDPNVINTSFSYMGDTAGPAITSTSANRSKTGLAAPNPPEPSGRGPAGYDASGNGPAGTGQN